MEHLIIDMLTPYGVRASISAEKFKTEFDSDCLDAPDTLPTGSTRKIDLYHSQNHRLMVFIGDGGSFRPGTFL